VITLDTVIDLLFAVGSIILVSIALGSWISKSRPSGTRVLGADNWFFSASLWPKLVVSVAVVVLGVAGGYLLGRPFASPPPGLSHVLRVIGLILFVVGAGFVLWARWTLGAMWSVSTGFGVELQPDHKLIQHGPFALVRHPIYAGFWVALFGATLAYHTWTALLLLLVSLVSFYRRAHFEEMALASTFGEEWQKYAAHVPRFVPRPR
jgi:protein-S-isoprenylcysteine O-methyltransferase Ste14